ncbi:M1 family aminopeptidase, partial [Candidatus Cloacimonadota bacterium]
SYVFTLSDPSGCRWWWPAYDHPWDKAEVDFHITMRDDWLVACNGIRTGIVDNEDGTMTHHWDGSNPMAPHLPCISAANFVEVNQDYEGMLVQNFVTPAQEEDAIVDLQNLPEIIDIFSYLFGDYPFEKYGNAVVPMVTFGAMEHQTMTTLAQYMITGDLSYEATIAHELAHQWFGNCLTPLTWADVWLSEGFATYSEAIYTEEMYGREAMLDYVFQNIQQYYLGWAGGGGHTVYDPTFNNYFNPVQYEKAASILHMLRKTLGDDDFYSVLQTFFQQYYNQCVVTSEFQSVIEEITGEDFSQFFQQWIFEPGIPTYEYTYFVNKTTDIHRIKTYVKTSSNTGTEFYLKIPVHIINDDQIFEILVDSAPDAAAETISEIELEDHQEVQFDPEGWMLVNGTSYRSASINDAYAADERVLIYWDEFWEEIVVDGFNVYRSDFPEGNYERINTELIAGNMFEDTVVENETTYYYKISAVVDEFYETDLSDPYEATPIEFTFDLGVLVVDETNDGNGAQGNPTDEMVDDFYNDVFPFTVTMYDYADQGVPTTEFLSHYSTVIWHDDDIGQHNINNALNPLGCFIISGGNLIISGWKTANEIEDFFLRDFVNEDNVDLIPSMDFTGVSSDTYSNMDIDFTKVSPAFQNGMPFICTFPDADEIIFTYNSLSGNNQDEICALSSNLNSRFIFLGFPLYFFTAEDVSAFMEDLMEELGETDSNTDDIPENILTLKAYPNPFNPATMVSFNLPEAYEKVNIKIYNVKGQMVKELVNASYLKGEHSVIWKGEDLYGNPVSSGLYFYKLEADRSVITNKLMLIK